MATTCDAFASYVMDFNTGEILMVSEAVCKLFHRDAADLVGAKCWTLCDPGNDDFCAFCPREQLLDADSRPTGPYSWKCYNEMANIWLHCTYEAALWTDGRLVQIVTAQEITRMQPEGETERPVADSRTARMNAHDVSELVDCMFSKPMRREELEMRLDGFSGATRCFAELPHEKQDMTNWLDGNIAYGAAQKILKLLNQVIQEVLSSKPAEESFALALRMLGEHLRLDRAFVYTHASAHTDSCHEWRRSRACSPRTLEQPWLREYPLTIERLEEYEADGMIVIEDADALPLSPLGPGGGSNRAVALIPMWDDEKPLGLMGFERAEPGPWPQESLIVLKDVSLVIRSVIIGESLKECVRETAVRVRAI